MKKIVSSLVLISFLSISIKSFAYPMDINNHWAKNQILELTNENIMHYSSNKFRPEDYITRAELTNAINNTFGFTETANINFKDVSNKSWYYNDIKKAIKANYIEGYQDGTMRPNNTVSREEAAKFIALACDLDHDLPSSLSKFKDSRDISNWAIVYVSLLNEAGYMSGHDDGTFKPKQPMRRGEIAAILSKIRLDTQDKIYHDIYDFGGDNVYTVQTGYFSNYNTALEMTNYLILNGFEDSYINNSKTPNMYAVLVCPSILNLKDAQIIQNDLKELGLDSFVTKDFSLSANICTPNKEKTSPKPINNNENFSVQVGIFSTLSSAKQIKTALQSKGFTNSYILKFNHDKNYYVMAKSNISKAEGNKLKKSLENAGYEGFVTNKTLSNITIY